MAKVHLSDFRPSNFLESNILFDWLSLLGEPKQVHCKQWDTFASKYRQANLDKVGPPGYSLILGHICLSSCRRAKQTVSTYGTEHCWCYVYVYCLWIYGGAATWGVPSSGGGLNILQRETNDRGQWEMEGCCLSAADACPNVFNVWFWVLFTG